MREGITMSDQNTNGATISGTTTNAQEQQVEQVKFYATREECEPNRPESAKSDAWKVYAVTRPNGETVYLWAFTGIQAVNDVARLDGYTASAAAKRAPVSKADVVAKLRMFTDEELAAMGLSRRTVDVTQDAPAPAPEKSRRQQKREAKAAANGTH